MIGLGLLQSDPAQVSAQSSELSGLRVDFTVTRFVPGSDVQPIPTEEGAFFIAPDGRYRVESLNRATGERTAQIVKFRENRRIVLNLGRKQATIGSNPATLAVPSGSRPAVPSGIPIVKGNAKSKMTSLGTKIVSGLVLEGSIQITSSSGNGESFVHTTELWAYRFDDPRILPIVMELRFEAAEEVVERRIDRVATIRLSPTIFEVPTGFTITRLNP